MGERLAASAVWFACVMGLLDDAIREHLELKRRNGADAGEVARQERAALEPVFPEEEPAGEGSASQAGDGAPALSDEHDQPEVAAREAEAHPGAHDPGLLSETAQETAELDMEAMLEQDYHRDAAAPPAAAHHDEGPRGAVEEDPLEWEMPGRGGGEGPPEQVPGQERMAFE